MAHDPDPGILSPDVVQEMVRKSFQIAAPKSATVKMEALGILGDPTDTNLKFREEIIAQLSRSVRVLFQDFVQVRLDPLVESNFHGC
jgi:hypothetical protein